MIDTTIRFNDHNSFKVTSILLGYPFGVEQMDYITHSFQAYSTSMLASATRARTKFFDADGARISDVSHQFAVTTVFDKVEITVAVPANAKQAQLVFLRGSSDWWLAEPKSEQGQVATPYNVNYAGQLTYITPNGIYTGMMTAGQIVVAGTTALPGETLDTKLVIISNGMINLSSTVSSKTTKITNEGVYTGEIVASQITSGYISADLIAVKSITGAKLADGTVTATQIAKATITDAEIANLAVTGAKIANLAVDNSKIANLHGSKITANSITADKINVTNLSAQKLTSGDFRQYFVASPGDWASLHAYDIDYSSSVPAWEMYGSGIQKWIRINAGQTQLLNIHPTQIWLGNGDFLLYSTNTTWQLGSNSSSATVCSGSYDTPNAVEIRYGNKGMGVDATGWYKRDNWTKTYF